MTTTQTMVLSDSAKRQIATLADDMGARIKAVVQRDLTAEVERMQIAAREAGEIEASAKAEKAALDRQIADLRATVEKVQGEARAAEDRRDALRFEVEELEPKVRTLRVEIEEKKQRVAAL
jgi:peptidoglycan hydrolase CwlO-like protein